MTFRRLAAAALAPVLLVAAGGCASRRTVQDLQRKVGALQSENFELRKQLAEARVRLESTRGAQGAVLTPPAEADSAQDFEAPMEPGPPASLEGSRVIYSEPITDAPAPPRAGVTGRVSPGRSVVAPGGGPEALMEAARRSLDAGDARAAGDLFARIVAEHPNHALADDAQAGVGDAQFHLGRHEDAIASYRKVSELFPFGDRVPYAFLKIAFAHLALDQRDLALDGFRTVSEAFPGTEAATVARQQIAHLTRR